MRQSVFQRFVALKSQRREDNGEGDRGMAEIERMRAVHEQQQQGQAVGGEGRQEDCSLGWRSDAMPRTTA